ncbi:MAG: hypothetical protein AB1345_01455 [Chloroflexota bacterium]
MHLTIGQMKAYNDGELDSREQALVCEHLSLCAPCGERLEALRLRSERVKGHLFTLDPDSGNAQFSLGNVRARMQTLLTKVQSEEVVMLKGIFGKRYRPVWITLAVVLLLSVALAFPSVQAIANGFLGLFRVQQIEVVQFNPANLPEDMESYLIKFERMLSDNIQVESQGEDQDVSDKFEASELAGFNVRLPADFKGDWRLIYQPAMQITFEVDRDRWQALLDEIGREDIELPRDIDGAVVTVNLYDMVTALYGTCALEEEAQEEINASDYTCTVLVQSPSPTVTALPGLEINQIGEAFLQVLGLREEEAAHFSGRVDWSTTLVVPIPAGAEYYDVIVDGVPGTIMERASGWNPRYTLVWLKDGLFYALAGEGDKEDALELAATLE